MLTFPVDCILAMNEDSTVIASTCPDSTLNVTTNPLSATPVTTLVDTGIAEVLFISQDGQKLAFLGGEIYHYDRATSQKTTP
jgi:dTDP-glucose pyrophosphorylase